MESALEAEIENKQKTNLLAVIRISGMVKINKKIENILDRLRLRRKYSCVLIPQNKSFIGIIKKVKFHISYGEINKETLIKLIKDRSKSIKGNKKKLKINTNEIVNNLINGKKLIDFGLKPFFRLHPPRGGIKSKLQYPKGVLGHNQNINELIKRML